MRRFFYGLPLFGGLLLWLDKRESVPAFWMNCRGGSRVRQKRCISGRGGKSKRMQGLQVEVGKGQKEPARMGQAGSLIFGKAKMMITPKMQTR